ncbi:MAG: adenylate/guanylate cyclase domain-containing protein [Acidimicrobiia bacterium]|nr:adenylate/guanylate cyclase domain-containing protein [Acidimicrobiia bacterium]
MRVDRSFAFADLCGFTNFTAENGDDAALDVLAEFRHHTRDVATEWAVHIDKWLGDGAMLVTDTPAPLLAAVVELSSHFPSAQCPLALRIGAAHGSVLLFEGDDYTGGVVNAAARLSDMAEPGSILVPAAMAEFAPPTAATIPLGDRQIRGLPHAQSLVVLRPVRNET